MRNVPGARADVVPDDTPTPSTSARSLLSFAAPGQELYSPSFDSLAQRNVVRWARKVRESLTFHSHFSPLSQDQKSPGAAILSHASRASLFGLLAATVFIPVTFRHRLRVLETSHRQVHTSCPRPQWYGKVRLVIVTILENLKGPYSRPFIAPLLRVRAASGVDSGVLFTTVGAVLRALLAWEGASALRMGYEGFVRPVIQFTKPY